MFMLRLLSAGFIYYINQKMAKFKNYLKNYLADI